MKWIKPISDVIDYIELNLESNIDQEILSRIFKGSISEMNHVFSFVVKTTIKDYIRKRRLSQAYFDVLNTDEKIIDIATKYQYNSHSSFSRAFVQYFMFSPIEVRREKSKLKIFEPFNLKQSEGVYRRMENEEVVRIIEIPNCKMVASKPGAFGDGNLETFDTWFSSFPEPTFPKDFLTYDHQKQGFVWLYLYDEKMIVPDLFEIIDFIGGLYIVASGIDGESDEIPKKAINDYLEKSEEFEYDDQRLQLGNVTTPKSAQEVLGYALMDYYVPIKKKVNSFKNV